MELDDQIVNDLRADIPFLQTGIYVDYASVSPLSRRVRAASERYDAIISEILREAKEMATPIFDSGRSFAAKLVGSSPHNIAYVQNTAHGLSMVALGVDWRPGDNLVVCAEEFPSNYLCWTQLESMGVELRRVYSSEGSLDTGAISAAMDRRTRLVTVSHVQFGTGYRVDIPALGSLCSGRGALLIVDGTQSIGALHLDTAANAVDVLVVSAHKWLMGPRGIGFASFSDRALDQISPRIVGWLSVNDPFAFNRTLDFLPGARRFEPGTPNGYGIFGLAERLRQIDGLGIDWIENRILQLNEALCEHATCCGVKLRNKFERKARSGITLLDRDGIAAPELHKKLTAAGIYTSVRNGAIRVSPHCYNTFDEMKQIISVMAS